MLNCDYAPARISGACDCYTVFVMATLKQCDGYGITSPDEDGYHIANRWVVVTVDPICRRSIYIETKWEFLLCESCFGVKESEPCRPWLAKVADAAIRAFSMKGWREPSSV